MEETLISQIMEGIDLINKLEKISSEIPNRIIKLEGFILKENHKEKLYSFNSSLISFQNQTEIVINNVEMFATISA